VIEKAKGRSPVPATDSTLRPGDFPLGSPQSRAAARALLEEHKRPKYPPAFEVNLSFLSIEKCREIYAKLLEEGGWQDPVRDGRPYFTTRWPNGFTPGAQQVPLCSGQSEESEEVLS
jgi:hypothetical protein